LEDIFNMGPTTGATVAPAMTPVAPVAAYSTPVHQDLMGLQPTPVLNTGVATMGSMGGTPAVGMGSQSGVNYPSRHNPDLLKKCFASTEGILYQDEFLQIGFKSEFSKGLGRVMLYYGNVCPQDIQNLTANITSGPNLVINPAPLASTLPSRNQGQQMITITAVAPFAETPLLQLSFQVGGAQHQFSLALPVILTKFTEPSGISGPQFFQLWRETENPPLSDNVILKPSSGVVSVPYLSEIISRVFHLEVLQNVDPNGNNIVAAGSLVTSKGRDPILLRIETNPQAGMYRATFRSTEAQITQGLKDLVSQQLV